MKITERKLYDIHLTHDEYYKLKENHHNLWVRLRALSSWSWTASTSIFEGLKYKIVAEVTATLKENELVEAQITERID